MVVVGHVQAPPTLRTSPLGRTPSLQPTPPPPLLSVKTGGGWGGSLEGGGDLIKKQTNANQR